MQNIQWKLRSVGKLTRAHLLMSFPLFPFVQDWGPPTAALAAALRKFIQFSQIVHVFQTSLCLSVFPSQLFPLCPLMTSYMHGRSLFSEIDLYKFVVHRLQHFMLLLFWSQERTLRKTLLSHLSFSGSISQFSDHMLESSTLGAINQTSKAP